MTAFSEDHELSLNLSLESLERYTSNPLERCDSNISCTSQEGGATFVPFGRGYTKNDFIYFSSLSITQTQDNHDVDDRINPPLEPHTNQFKLNQSSTDSNNSNDSSYSTENKKPYIEITKQSKHKQKKQTKSANIMPISDLIKMKLSLTQLLQRDLICLFCKDQNGSRYLQDQLKNASADIMEKILNHMIFTRHEIVNLSQDIYGNYILQMLFQIGNKCQHKLLLIHLLKGNVSRLTHSFYGCRVVQTAFDYVNTTESIKLAKELNTKQITSCVLGQNSHHVVQKILSLHLELKHVEFIINCVCGDLYFFSAHIFGCRVVQTILNNYHECVLYKIMNDEALILKLSKSEYGNYCIQDILEILDLSDCDNVHSALRLTVFRNVRLLSKNKFGSNVVEKCLLSSNDEERSVLLNQITGNIAILVSMVHDKFANYVIQSFLLNSNHKQQSKLIYLIEKHIPNLRSLKYGKHIMDKIMKIKSKYKSSNI